MIPCPIKLLTCPPSGEGASCIGVIIFQEYIKEQA
jgi:hypothetical protein